MYYNTIEVYESKDNQIFKTEKEVKKYILNSLCEEVTKLINEEIKDTTTESDLHPRDKISIVLALVGDFKQIEKLQAILNKYI